MNTGWLLYCTAYRVQCCRVQDSTLSHSSWEPYQWYWTVLNDVVQSSPTQIMYYIVVYCTLFIASTVLLYFSTVQFCRQYILTGLTASSTVFHCHCIYYIGQHYPSRTGAVSWLPAELLSETLISLSVFHNFNFAAKTGGAAKSNATFQSTCAAVAWLA